MIKRKGRGLRGECSYALRGKPSAFAECERPPIQTRTGGIPEEKGPRKNLRRTYFCQKNAEQKTLLKYKEKFLEGGREASVLLGRKNGKFWGGGGVLSLKIEAGRGEKENLLQEREGSNQRGKKHLLFLAG